MDTNIVSYADLADSTPLLGNVPMPMEETMIAEPTFSESTEPVDEEMLDQDTSIIDGFVDKVMKDWENTTKMNSAQLGNLAVRTCNADLDNCASKLGVTI